MCSKKMSVKIELKTHETMTRPMVLCRCVTCKMIKIDKITLEILERKVWRREHGSREVENQ